MKVSAMHLKRGGGGGGGGGICKDTVFKRVAGIWIENMAPA